MIFVGKSSAFLLAFNFFPIENLQLQNFLDPLDYLDPFYFLDFLDPLDFLDFSAFQI
ncbi:MAG: hypothetical protein ACOH1O_13735 [Flavobacterium sp.]